MAKKGKKVIKILSIVIGGIGAFIGIIALIVALSGSKLQTVTIGGVSKELVVGNIDYSSVELSLSIYPETATNEPITIYSENPEIAKVQYSNGIIKVTAVSEGVTNVIVVANNDTSVYDKCEIIVKDVAVESLTFFDEQNENETTSYRIKRDGSIYSIPFNVYPLSSNLDNIEPYFDKSVFSSVVINQEKMTLDIEAIEDVEVDSSLITLYVKQITNEGLKRVGAEYLQIFIEPKKIEMTIGLLGSFGSSDIYTTEHTNLVYLDKEDSVANSVRAKINLKTILSEGKYVDEDFSPHSYNVYLNNVLIEIENQTTSDYIRINAVVGQLSSYFEIISLNLDYGQSVMLTFVHKKTGEHLDLVITGAERLQPVAPAEVQNLTVDTQVSSIINEMTYSNSTFKVELKNVTSWEFVDENNNPLNNDVVQINKINGVIFVKGLAIGSQYVKFIVRNIYWDDRFAGPSSSEIIILFNVQN